MAGLVRISRCARLNGGLAFQRTALRRSESLICTSRLFSNARTPPAAETKPNGRSSFGGLTAGLGLLAVGSAMHGYSRPVHCDDGIASAPPKAEPSLLVKCAAEAVGVFIIIHGGCGVICSKAYAGSGLGLFQISGVWALTIALAIFATREISGAHLNPAVSVALAVNKDFSWTECGPYIAAQTAGAALAGGLNYIIHQAGIVALEAKDKLVRGTTTAAINGAFGMYPNAALVTPMGAFLCEIFMTAKFAFLIFMATDPNGTVPGDAAPFMIGSAAGCLIATYGPLTGCGMNPARDLGPRWITAQVGFGSIAWSHAWIYTLGPILGAVIGGACYNAFFAPLQPEKK